MLSGDILRLSAQRHPAKTALICGDRTWSYGQVDAMANRFASALAGLGMGKGDRVAVICPNIAEYALIHFGAARLGCVLVNLSTMYAAEEIATIIGRTRASVLVVDGESCPRIAEIRDRLECVRTIISIGPPGALDAIGFEEFLAGGDAALPATTLTDTDPLGMTFTGGTTGQPKGALVTHKARHISAYTTALEHELTAADVVAAVTPLFHAVGLYIWFQAAILTGCTCVLIRRWDAQAFIDAVARHKISAVMTVPVQLVGVLQDGTFDAAKLSSLKKIGSGGANVSAEIIARCIALLPGVRVVDHYGQSETGPLTFLKPGDPPEKFGSIGRPAIGVDMRIVDTAGKQVDPGEICEIVVLGDFVFEGYFENPEETALYFRSGDRWGWTGDLGILDEDGYITLAGRSKDMIVTGGINVYPRELEVVLEQHPSVGECTVIGVPDEKWGEALVAYVVSAPGHAADDGTLIDFCGAYLAPFKRPREVRFTDEIPKTPAGKIQKLRLREAYLAGHTG